MRLKMENPTEDRRKYKRFPVELSARYQRDNKTAWKGCTVTNISRGGMGIIVYLQEKIPLESPLVLEIIFPPEEKQIKATGILRWLEEGKDIFIGGVEFTEIDPEDKWVLLDYAFDEWSKKEKDA